MATMSPARTARTPVLSAMSALNASAQRGHDDMRGFAGRARIETHHPAKHSALESLAHGDDSLAHRIHQRTSSQLYGWRTRTAGLKAAKLETVPHVPHDRMEPAHHGLAGVRLESTFWHSLQHGQVKVNAMVDLALSGSPSYDS